MRRGTPSYYGAAQLDFSDASCNYADSVLAAVGYNCTALTSVSLSSFQTTGEGLSVLTQFSKRIRSMSLDNLAHVQDSVISARSPNISLSWKN